MKDWKALVAVATGHEDLAERWFSSHDVTVEAEDAKTGTFSWYVVAGRGATLEAMERTRMFVSVLRRLADTTVEGESK